jgi:hypothetical protein
MNYICFLGILLGALAVSNGRLYKELEDNSNCNCQNTGWPGTTFACGSNGITYYDYEATCMSQCLGIAILYAGRCGKYFRFQ